MSYTKNEILTLVKNLTQFQADDVTIDSYFDQLLDDLGRLPDPLLLDVEVLPVTANTCTYTLPDNAILERAIFFDDHELRRVTSQSLEARSATWRDHVGVPFAYTKDESTARQFRIYPCPNFSSTATDWSEGEPLGKGFPSDALTLFFTSRANDKIPNWLVLPMCLQIMAWEFQRPAPHQSIPFSQACQQLATLFFQFLNIDFSGVPKGVSR